MGSGSGSESGMPRDSLWVKRHNTRVGAGCGMHTLCETDPGLKDGWIRRMFFSLKLILICIIIFMACLAVTAIFGYIFVKKDLIR